jgi:hypothetical protein
MRTATRVWAALLVPFAAQLLVTSWLVWWGRIGGPAFPREELVQLLVYLGIPQYLTFALLFALAARRLNVTGIRRLAWWSPCLFVPLFVLPIVWGDATRPVDVVQISVLFACFEVPVGFVMVGLARCMDEVLVAAYGTSEKFNSEQGASS